MASKVDMRRMRNSWLRYRGFGALVVFLASISLTLTVFRRHNSIGLENYALASTLHPISLVSGAESQHIENLAWTSSLKLISHTESDKLSDRGSIVGVYGVTVDADSDCQHILSCPHSPPKPTVSAPVHYHKQINMVSIQNYVHGVNERGLTFEHTRLDSVMPFRHEDWGI